MNKLILALHLLVIGAVALLYSDRQSLAEDNDRLHNNQFELLKQATVYKTESAKNALTVKQLQLTLEEVKAYNNDLEAQVKDLGIQLKRVQSAQTTSTATTVKVETVLRDSIIFINNVRDSVNYIAWSDPWVQVDGTINRGMCNMCIYSVDTLDQIVHREPKKFLFFKWGTKAIRQEIVSRNPHTRIVYSNCIRFT